MNPFLHKESKVSHALHWASLLAIGSTFFGFLVVNIYLALHGFWDFNFLKVQYFSAGGLLIFFFAFPTMFFYAFLKAREKLNEYRGKNASKLKRALVFVFKILLFAVTVWISTMIFAFPVMLSKMINPPSFVYFLGLVWVGLVFMGVWIAFKFQNEVAESQGKPVTLRNMAVYFGAYYRLLYFLFAVPIAIFMFSFLIYPTIPRYLGGAKPVAVTINFKQDAQMEGISTSNPLDAIMVYESENSALIVVEEGTYLIKQSDINYVKYPGAIAKVRRLQEFTNTATTTGN